MNVPVLIAACPMVLGLLAAVSTTGCHSTGSSKSDPHTPLTYQQRTAVKKGQPDKMSSFNKMLTTSALGDRGMMKAVGKKSFGTADYKGNTTYKGSKDYQTKDFAGGGKASNEQSKMSAFASQKSKFADKTFATNESRWSTKAAQGHDKVYAKAGQQYKTPDYEPAAKSLTDNKQPYFKAPKDLDKARTYPEDEVRALLNRN